MGKEYGNESMQEQETVVAVRMYPNNYLGTKGIEGTTQTIHEILSNSVDEAKSGYGKKIIVKIHKDCAVTIQDFGRGIPLDINPKTKKWNWDIAFMKIHAGGKMADDRSNYKKSGGQHGIGAGVTQMSSEWFKCESRRDGYILNVEFKEGRPVEKDINKVLKKQKDPKGSKQITGTTVSWKPDIRPDKDGNRVFTSIDYDLEELKKWVQSQAVTCKGVEFILEDERVGFKQSYFYKDGLKEFVQELLGKDSKKEIYEIIATGSGRDDKDSKVYEVDCDVVFAFTDGIGYSAYYHNNIPMGQGGSPDEAMKEAFVSYFTDELKKKKMLDGKKIIKWEDIGENLIFISHTETEEPPSFKGQTKDLIANYFIKQFLITQISKKLKEWSKENSLEFDNVCKQISINVESRTKASEIRSVTKQNLSEKMGMKTDRIKNFVDCLSKEVSERELFISEGLSAQSSLKQARNGRTQALMCIRGKSLNLYKADYKKIFENDLVMDMMKVVGTGVEVENGRKNTLGDFNIENRRFDKIILSADADVDGLHIVSLLLTMFYKLTPKLIEQGYIYVLDTPLFEIKVLDGVDKGKYFYAYSDEEMEKISKGRKVSLARNKGLGEVDKEQMSIFLSPETRRLTKITMNDIKKAKKTLDLFMDENSQERKDYMMNNGERFIEQAEEDVG